MVSGDWIDMTNAKPTHPFKGVPSCPFCKGEGQYLKKDCTSCYDRGEHWTEDAVVICTRCTIDILFERELENVSLHDRVNLLKPLVGRLREASGAPDGEALGEDACRALYEIARLLAKEEAP